MVERIERAWNYVDWLMKEQRRYDTHCRSRNLAFVLCAFSIDPNLTQNLEFLFPGCCLSFRVTNPFPYCRSVVCEWLSARIWKETSRETKPPRKIPEREREEENTWNWPWSELLRISNLTYVSLTQHSNIVHNKRSAVSAVATIAWLLQGYASSPLTMCTTWRIFPKCKRSCRN